MIIFASDLDNTLIYSAGKKKKEYVPVEWREGRGVNGVQEISFMSPRALFLLKKISAKCLFIPVTTRSLEQYRRINFGFVPEYALVANGAILLKNGIIDSDWILESKRIFNQNLPKITENDFIFDVRTVNDFFLFMKSNEPQKAVEYLKNPDFNVTAVNKKIYIFPKNLHKGTALERLKKLLNPEMLISAGDSILDEPMFEVSDKFYKISCAREGAESIK